MYCNFFNCRYLHGNKLTGPIPPELGNMSKLHYLYGCFLSNMISALNISPALFSLHLRLSSTLKTVFCRELNDNQLTGCIPPELGKLNELFDLYILYLFSFYFGLVIICFLSCLCVMFQKCCKQSP